MPVQTLKKLFLIKKTPFSIFGIRDDIHQIGTKMMHLCLLASVSQKEKLNFKQLFKTVKG